MVSGLSETQLSTYYMLCGPRPLPGPDVSGEDKRRWSAFYHELVKLAERCLEGAAAASPSP